MLNSTRIPRGTMSADQINKTLYAVSAWCHNHRGLATADRLVNRLGAEFASGSFVAKKFTKNLVDSHLHVIISTCEVSPNDQDSLERAEALLRRVVAWNQSGAIPEIPVIGLEALVQTWLALGEDAKAADLMLWWTDHFTSHEEQLAPFFDRILKQSFDADNDLSADLIQKIQELKHESGWKSFRIDTPELQVSSTSSADDTELDLEGEERSLEMVMLMSKMVEFLSNASKEDYDEVQTYQKKLLQLTGLDLTEDVCESLLKYYIRIKDSKQATVWLRKLDQFGSGSSIFDRALDVLRLLADGKPGGTPWRAAEIFQRMEQLEADDAGTVTPKMCQLYCSIWRQSGEAAAEKQIEDTVQKMMVAAMNKDPENQLDKETYKVAFGILVHTSAGLTTALKLLIERWHDLDKSILEDHTRILMRKLAGFGRAKEAGMLLQLACKANMTFDDKAISKYVEAHVTSPDPMSVFEAFDYINQLNGRNVSFECYAQTIRVLLEVKWTEGAREEMNLITFVLYAVRDGSLVATVEEVRKLVDDITSQMAKKHQAAEAETILDIFQSNGSGADFSKLDYLSTTSFNNVLEGWVEIDTPKKVAAQFSKLKQYHDAGVPHLMPDRVSYGLLLRAFSKRNNCADEAEQILKLLLALYQQSGLENLKPDEGHFQSVLIALEAEAPADVAAKRLKLIDQVKELDVSIGVVTFNAVMAALLGSNSETMFSRIFEYQQLMVKASVEPNQITYRILLDACAISRSLDKQLAIDLVLESITQARQSGLVDVHIYSSATKALQRLLSGDKRAAKITSALMRDCKKDGLLDANLEVEFQKLIQH